MINFAIVGAGSIAKLMATTIKMMNKGGDESVKLYAIASRSLEKAKEFAKEFGIEKAYGSYEELYNDPAINLVYIATPHNFHYEQTKACLEHGKHVLCEKAFTVNAKEAKELIDLSKEKKLLLAEAIWTRYQPMRQIINDVISSGIVGPAYMITANLGYSIADKPRLVKKDLAGGALLDVGVYPINFTNMIFGDPTGVEATCIKNQEGVDVSNSITLTYADTGRMAVLCSSAICVSDRFGMIHCKDGFIQVENINNPQSIQVFNKQYQLIKEIKCPKQYTGYEYEVVACVKAIEAGLCECEQMPHERTLYIMNLLDSIRAQLGIKYPFEKLNK